MKDPGGHSVRSHPDDGQEDLFVGRIYSSGAKEWDAQAWAKHRAVPSIGYHLPLRLPSGWHPGSHIYIKEKSENHRQQWPWAQAMNPAQRSRLRWHHFNRGQQGQQHVSKAVSNRAVPGPWQTASLGTSGRYILGLVDSSAESSCRHHSWRRHHKLTWSWEHMRYLPENSWGKSYGKHKIL